MTYEEFLDRPTTFMDDMLQVINIKNKYRLQFTEEEKQINQHLMTYWEEMKLNELRGKFERCWEITNE
ncbi:hypothetical protein EB151_07585 [archaeon]|jgi:hypothetical protein|nr:hypothetical protein [archaeon]